MRLFYVSMVLPFIWQATSAPAQLSSVFKDAKPVLVYSPAERAAAFQDLMHLPSQPRLGTPVSVTPNAPYALDGTRLYFWKPSFLIGTPSAGEAGVNFWGLYNDGHVNISFTAGSAKSYALDCRILSNGPITHKFFGDSREASISQGDTNLGKNHLLLVVPTSTVGASMLVEMWPSPTTAVVGFLGCDLSPILP
jgi:hypothetical protein